MPIRLRAEYDTCMNVTLMGFGVTISATAVWLLVQIINRRTRRVKWTLVILIGLSITGAAAYIQNARREAHASAGSSAFRRVLMEMGGSSEHLQMYRDEDGVGPMRDVVADNGNRLTS